MSTPSALSVVRPSILSRRGAILLVALGLATSACVRAPIDQVCQEHYQHGRYTEASLPCRIAARLGSARARAALCVMYFNGWGVEKDLNKAVEFCSEASQDGQEQASLILGIMYLTGQGVALDYSKARSLLLPLAEKGNPDAAGWVGAIYLLGMGTKPDYKAARRWLEQGTRAGSAAVAGFYLGLMHYRGLGVPKDPKKALENFLAAANHGNLVGAAFAGEIFYKGQSGKRNLSQARTWLEKASAEDVPKAWLYLGLMSIRGEGAKRDLPRGLQLVVRAAQDGEVEAAKELARLYSEGGFVQTDYREIAHWLKGAAEAGDAEAAYRLGVMFGEGEGVEKDLREAEHWLEEAEKEGSREAEKRLRDIRAGKQQPCEGRARHRPRGIPQWVVYPGSRIEGVDNHLEHPGWGYAVTRMRTQDQVQDVVFYYVDALERQGYTVDPVQLLPEAAVINGYGPYYVHLIVGAPTPSRRRPSRFAVALSYRPLW